MWLSQILGESDILENLNFSKRDSKIAKMFCYALIFLIAFSAIIATTSNVKAAATYDTEVYITASPNPIGTGQ